MYKLTGSIHTFSIKIEGVLAADLELPKGTLKEYSIAPDGQTAKAIINLNKMDGDVLVYSDFVEKLEDFKKYTDMTEYRFTRADMRFDNYDSEHYKEFAKLNRYLISMLAVEYQVKNTYKTENLFTQEQVSVAAKNHYFQVENYDRNAKSRLTKNHKDPAQARLEERTIAKEWRILYAKASEHEKNTELLRKEFCEKWFYRWDKAIDNIDAVAERYNNELERIYKENKDVFPVKFRSLTDFLIQYQDCIFTKSQMIDLLSRFLEVQNPKNRAESHKKKYGIEYFSKTDVKKAISEIKRATLEFFQG